MHISNHILVNSSLTLLPVGYIHPLVIYEFRWFAGTSGDIETNSPQVPDPWSHFADYWSCSFITIQGGVPLASSYTPVFINDQAFDMSAPGAEGADQGCMAQNDAPGICAVESCDGIKGIYQKPAAFKSGPPRALTPADFGGDNSAATSSGGAVTVTPTPSASPASSTDTETNTETETTNTDTTSTKSGEIQWKGRTSCVCLINDDKCHAGTAQWSDGCKAETAGVDQPLSCKKSCCDMCKTENTYFCTLMIEKCNS